MLPLKGTPRVVPENTVNRSTSAYPNILAKYEQSFSEREVRRPPIERKLDRVNNRLAFKPKIIGISDDSPSQHHS